MHILFYMRILPRFAVAALVAVGPFAHAADGNERAASVRAGPPSSLQQQELYRGSKIIGAQVRDAHNHKIGEIKDLLLDSARGELAYAVVKFTDAAPRKLYPVPWPALVPDRSGRHYVLHADREVVGQAPGFEAMRWPDMSDQRWSDEIDRYWNRAVGRGPYVAQPGGSDKPPGAPTSGGAAAPPTGNAGRGTERR
jgi:hypothetical protein